MKLSEESRDALEGRIAELCGLRDNIQRTAKSIRESLDRTNRNIDNIVRKITSIQEDLDA